MHKINVHQKAAVKINTKSNRPAGAGCSTTECSVSYEREGEGGRAVMTTEVNLEENLCCLGNFRQLLLGVIMA